MTKPSAAIGTPGRPSSAELAKVMGVEAAIRRQGGFSRALRLSLVASLATAVAHAAPAVAPPQEDPRDARIRELSDRVVDLERALQGVNAQLETTSRAADLARGDLNRLRDRVSDLESARSTGASVGAPGAAPAGASPQPSQPEAASQQTSSQSAAAPSPGVSASGSTVAPAAPATATLAASIEDGLTRGRRQLQSGDPAGAEATLTVWLTANSGDPKAGEATYLRGRARALQTAWPDAASDYINALKGWPRTWWAPDAVVELARSLGRLGKTTEACQALVELTSRYPAAPDSTKKRAAAVSAQSGCTS